MENNNGLIELPDYNYDNSDNEEMFKDKIESKIIENEKESDNSNEKKLTSFQTIFSIWNTMVGSNIVSLPYNVYCAGIIPTIFICILYGYVCYYSGTIYARLGKNEDNFCMVTYNYFYYAFGVKYAKAGKYIYIIFELLMNVGAAFIFFLIINQNLYPCVCFFLRLFDVELDDNDFTPYFNQFSIIYCALILCFILFPLTILKEMRILTKISAYGVYFVSFLLFFVIYTGFASLAKDSFRIEYKENIEGNKVRNIFLFGKNIGLLAGNISVGFFSHAVIIPIMKKNKNQEKNKRDLFLAFLFVVVTYIVIGIFGYIGFSGSDFKSNYEKNWFRFFKSDNIFILILRIFSVFQLISIFPLILFVDRTTIFTNFVRSYIDKLKPIIIFSIIALLLCILILYFFYDLLPELIGFIGAGSAIILVYSFPPICNMIDYYIKHKQKDEIKKLKKEKLLTTININEEEVVNLIRWKANLFYISMILIIILGILTLILQIAPINFFNINIEKN